MNNIDLSPVFDRLEQEIETLQIASEYLSMSEFSAFLETATQIAKQLLAVYANAYKKEMPESDDLLEHFKAFVKSDPSLTAVRDNVRELVFYKNCLLQDRLDALPANPPKMTGHTVKHIYLYLRSRAEQENLLG